MCTLLSIIGEEAVKVFETVQYAGGVSEDTLVDVLTKFKEQCNPRQNTIY